MTSVPSSSIEKRQSTLPLALCLPLFCLICCTGLTLSRIDCEAAQSSHTESGASLPPNVQLIVFLGDSITYSCTYVILFESYFIIRYPLRQLVLITIGLQY